jgi:hypothetical protein
MRPLLFAVVLALLGVKPLAGQVEAAGSRCIELSKLLRIAPAAAADLASAKDACDRYQAALRSHDGARIEDTSTQAGAALERLGLTGKTIFARTESAAASLSGLPRFHVLADLAKQAVNVGEVEKAQTYARELLQMATQFRGDWNYGNAIYYGYFVLGRAALQQGNLKLAVQYLLDSASTPGSPQLNTFGPNVTLAKELLDKGQSGPVLQYLAQVRTFWKNDSGKINAWTSAIRSGAAPDFTSNLNY